VVVFRDERGCMPIPDSWGKNRAKSNTHALYLCRHVCTRKGESHESRKKTLKHCGEGDVSIIVEEKVGVAEVKGKRRHLAPRGLVHFLSKGRKKGGPPRRDASSTSKR